MKLFIADSLSVTAHEVIFCQSKFSRQILRFSVMGSYSGFHTEQVSGIASYFEHPLDVTTSQNFVEEMSQAVPQITKYETLSQKTQQHTIDDNNIADTSSMLYNEVSRDSRRRDFQRLKDPKIMKIYEITIVSYSISKFWKEWNRKIRPLFNFNLKQCLNPNPYERPSATELFEELEVFETTTWKRVSYNNPMTFE